MLDLNPFPVKSALEDQETKCWHFDPRRFNRRIRKQTGENFPEELANLLRHMIVSHHGSYEFRSPKRPMSLKAIALHHLDNQDAQLNSVCQLIDEDVNKGSAWTVYHPNIGRKLYKGQ